MACISAVGGICAFCATRIESPFHADADSVRAWEEFPPQELIKFNCENICSFSSTLQ